MYDAIDSLDEKYKTPIILQYFQDLTILQIAEVMECNENTIKSYIRRGRKIIRYIKGDKIMNKFNDIKIPDNINEITKIAINKGKKHKKSNKYRKTMIASVASLGVILTLGINNPSLAYNIPVLGDIFDKINYALKNKESFKDNISDINSSSEYNGLTITIDKAIYDGNNVYIDYIIKTEEPFKETIYANTLHEYEIDKDSGEMIYYFNQYYPEFKINGVKPNGYGADTPRVKYVDEYTLKGSAMYNFDVINQVKSDTIDFEMEFGLYSNDVDENGNFKMLDGKWAFQFSYKF